MNRIFIDDCFSVMREMDDKSVDFVLSDIPYNEVNGKEENGFQRVNRGDADRADNGVVFDGCAGSLTTAVAANELGRKYICVENNSGYVDKARAHWGEKLGNYYVRANND